jgi:hypothetical protein
VYHRFEFDEWAKDLARGLSRREALRRLGGGFAGALLASLGLGAAWAKPGNGSGGSTFQKCSDYCSTLPRPQRANCNNACKQCGGHYENVCASLNSTKVTCCDPGACCINGQCTPTDLTGNENCGACGNRCTGGTICVNGACQCPSGQANCSGTCTTMGTNQNCAACGNACMGGQSCVNGVCECPAGESLCPNSTTCCPPDRACCGEVCCGPNEACGDDGSCHCGTGVACSGSQTCCGGSCVDTQTSFGHCGGCGNACVGGKADHCEGGVCKCGSGSACTGTDICGPNTDGDITCHGE